jgi:ligand-binding sensor domain-containing protein/signal transduction histidine kinase
MLPAWLGVLLLGGASGAWALDTALAVSQYAHTAWTVREGFSKGSITSITQTPDGYLWLGTEFGLLRFDGVRSVPFEAPAGAHLPSTFIRNLLAARDGSLWIGTAEGLASLKDGKLRVYPELAGQAIDALLEDREGTVWAGGQGAPAGRLCAIQAARVLCYGEDGSLGQSVESLYEDQNGNLWVGAMSGLWRWKPGAPQQYVVAETVQAMMEDDSGVLLVAMRGGLRQFIAGRVQEFALPPGVRGFTPNELRRDGNGGQWIGTTDRGLLHLHGGKIDTYTQSDGLSSNFIEKIFADREGSIWVATLDGLDRFREFAVPTLSVKQGLSNATVESVLAARDGSIWLGTLDGLNRWQRGQVTVYRKGNGLPDDAIESLFEDAQGRIWVGTGRGVAYLRNGRFVAVADMQVGARSIAEDRAGNLWISQTESLLRLRDGKVVERISWAKLGRGDPGRALVGDPLRGGLWIGFRDGGVAYFDGSEVRARYGIGEDLAAGHIRGLQLGQDGTLWVAAEGGLSRVKNGKLVTLTSKNGLPCDAVHWAMEDDAQAMWLYMACGLVRVARAELEAWVNDPKRTVQTALFDSADGIRNHATTTGYCPSVAKSADGRIWFLPWDGVSVLDPLHLVGNKLPPPVNIERVIADGKTLAASAQLPMRLPPLVRDLEIDYTALSLVAPEKVLFRFKLDGRDGDWQDVGNRRQAFYTNLSPGKYRFRVSACNNSGVWNEAGTYLDFSIAPAYFETVWFRLLCVAAFFVLLWGLYQLRLRNVARNFNMRLEERVGERTRIAQELHDTLLQSFQGLILNFQRARNVLPGRPTQAMELLDGALDQAEQAIVEGRDAIHDIRSSVPLSNDLAKEITALGQTLDMTSGRGESPTFGVLVEGTPHAIAPVLRQEIYCIVREALRNAYGHARARSIEAEITYDQGLLRVRVRDDGVGIDLKLLGQAGRAGHWGLPGMRERAKRIGAQLEVWSELGAGTEIELRIPNLPAGAPDSAGGSDSSSKTETGSGRKS